MSTHTKKKHLFSTLSTTYAIFIVVGFVQKMKIDSTHLRKYTTGCVKKGHENYIASNIDGRGAVLQYPYSDVSLTVPPGVHCTIIGCIHTHDYDLLNEIPEDECLIAPIPDYTCFLKQKAPMKDIFEIKIPHCIQNTKRLSSILVRKGDIHKNIPFQVIPRKTPFTPATQTCYEVDECFITVYTSWFSQFICTSCNKECDREIHGKLYGSHVMLNKDHLAHISELYLVGPLYSIKDFQKVIHFHILKGHVLTFHFHFQLYSNLLLQNMWLFKI